MFDMNRRRITLKARWWVSNPKAKGLIQTIGNLRKVIKIRNTRGTSIMIGAKR